MGGCVMAEVNERQALERFVARYRTQQLAAEAIGLSPQYLGQLLHGARPLPVWVLAKLGLRRAVVEAVR